MDDKEVNRLKNEIGEREDATKYGEFVSSYFAWLTLARQKERAEDMDNMTKKINHKKAKTQVWKKPHLLKGFTSVKKSVVTESCKHIFRLRPQVLLRSQHAP